MLQQWQKLLTCLIQSWVMINGLNRAIDKCFSTPREKINRPGINIATPNKPHTINTGSIIQAIHRHTKSQIKHVLGTQKQPCRNIKISRIAHHAFLWPILEVFFRTNHFSLIHNNFPGKTKKTVMATKRGKIKEKELCRDKNKMKQAGSRKSVEGNKSLFLW